jgi:hypothetical protein
MNSKSMFSFKLVSLNFCVFIILLSAACDKYRRWDLPVKADLDLSVSSTSNDSIVIKGDILNEDHGVITERGLIVVKGNDFLQADTLYPVSFDDKSVYFKLLNFELSSYYEMKFYVIGEAGLSCSKIMSFTTGNPIGAPEVHTLAPGETTISSTRLYGTVYSQGNQIVTQRGFCWSTSTNPTTSNSSVTVGSGLGAFDFKVDNLIPSTLYYVRAYATNAIATSYGEQLTFQTSDLGQLTYGDSVYGGLFFYYLQPGDAGYVSGEIHGLVAATEDQGTGTGWGCPGSNIATSQSIGSGMSNSQQIVSNCADPVFAAKSCMNLSLNGYTDWYLPSFEELRQMRQNLVLNGLGNFFPSWYWSSHQFTGVTAGSVNFNINQTDVGNFPKEYTYRVRAIRMF